MRISDPKSSTISDLAQSNGIGPAGDGGRLLRGPAGQAFSSDQVQLSNLSSNLAATQMNSPQWTGKISHLTAAVGSGSYSVDAHVVGGSIIDDSLQFSGF